MYYHITKLENIDSILEKGLIPQVGERSWLDYESEPRVYLFKTLEDSNEALNSWVNDFIPESKVRLHIDSSNLNCTERDSWEVLCTEVIPSHLILKVEFL